MKRKKFIKSSLAAGMALTMLPHLAFQTSKDQITYSELIGKGNPKLFGDGFLLRKDAYKAFLKMKAEAQKSNINIQIVSSYRSYDHQNRIWERKYNRFLNQGLTSEQSIKNIIKYSTIPGTSRHHWATDIDVIDANPMQPSSILRPSHFEKNGCYNNLKLWMDHNANRFGFYLVYTNNYNRKGFKYEPWHYSFRPLSYHYLSQFKTLNISEIITNENLLGHSDFSNEFISNYLTNNILDINPELL